MKHWAKQKTIMGYGKEGVVLKGGDQRILSVSQVNELFVFAEECDAHFIAYYSKEEALEALEELKNWIKSQ